MKQSVGRFAPSPTGALHFGSLVAALGSYLSVRNQNGRWFVRIEDLDPPREEAGAADNILTLLKAYGFEWHGEVLYQSQRHQHYQAALKQLKQHNLIYACRCSRKQLQQRLCPCQTQQHPETDSALKLIVPDQTLFFQDQLCAHQQQNLAQEVGDVVLKRRDGLFAYQLAVVVDDAAQGITEVVRGADLLDNTLRQIYLQQQLGYPTPRYSHLPLVKNERGEKLSKQNLAPPLKKENALIELQRAWRFLYQQEIDTPLDTVADFWLWALSERA
ncbi:MAG: tRNA glutamyl-Q(34) synthetase GluQRS [Gammaproteobacteria bacterium]|nr:tRNA glutamyl-Q(34) synthetase GluQRS [Gammaproteobacteria bacterium]